MTDDSGRESREPARVGAKVYVLAEGTVTAATAHRVSVEWLPPLDGGTVHVTSGPAHGAAKEPLPASAYEGDPVAAAYAQGALDMRARAAAVARDLADADRRYGASYGNPGAVALETAADDIEALTPEIPT